MNQNLLKPQVTQFPWVATESSEGWFVRTGSTPITPIDWLVEEEAHKISAIPELIEACQKALQGFEILIAADDLSDDERLQVALLETALEKALNIK